LLSPIFRVANRQNVQIMKTHVRHNQLDDSISW